MIRDLKKLIGPKTDDELLLQKYKQFAKESSRPSPDLHLKLGRLYEKLGNKGAAITEYRNSAKLYADVENYIATLVVNNLLVRLDREDRDALAQIAFIEFQQGIKLSKQEFEQFLQEADQPLKPPKKQPSAVSSKHSSSRMALDRGRRATQRVDANFQSNRQSLIDLIEGGSGAEAPLPPTSQPETQKKSATDEEVAASDLLHDNETLIDLRKTATPTMDDRWLQLQQCSLFLDLSEAEFKKLKQHVRVREFEQNAPIMPAVSSQQALFIILEGTVDLIIAYRENKRKSAVLALKTGDFWGEHTLLEQEDIVLSAVAKSKCVISEFPKAIIAPLAKRHSSLLNCLKKECKRHCFYPILSFMPLFQHLTAEEKQSIAEHLFTISVAEGTEIIHEGEFDESIYLIKSGKVEVYTSFVEREELQVVQVAQERARLAILQTGDFFGEGAFFTKEPRSATIMASTDVELLKLTAEHLKAVIKDYPRVEEILKQYHQQRIANTMETLQSIF